MSNKIGDTRSPRPSNEAAVIQCFNLAKDFPQYREKWIEAVVWVHIIRESVTGIPKGTNLTVGVLNKGLTNQQPYKNHRLTDQNVVNALGVYGHRWGDKMGYYATDPDQLPKELSNQGRWKDRLEVSH